MEYLWPRDLMEVYSFGILTGGGCRAIAYPSKPLMEEYLSTKLVHFCGTLLSPILGDARGKDTFWKGGISLVIIIKRTNWHDCLGLTFRKIHYRRTLYLVW